eukprot:CAMPEP_0194142634 /NCGR_PEP_ID=MMETSP0152-20130528/11861_1 /TAXON_ID=1049557 /ORGANISM="Thalassiothrix antarctica, Strain L6-D1" /LENGTH=207 /DNA_ID=CAMNT_0038841659 /DNA_START=180 /DNA_END=803 /DNA_ORIENTATION=+
MVTTSTDENEGGVIMLSGYPFYLRGADPKALAEVADKNRVLLESIFSSQMKSFNRMGSSTIDGLAGTPVCDIVVELSPWPMTDETKGKMAIAGYEYKGVGSHTSQDEWFFGGEGKPGHLGRVVLHTVPEGSEFVRDMNAFVEYVKTHPNAFQRYNDVKVKGAVCMSKKSMEDGKLLGYKREKAEVCDKIKEEAIDWWTKRETKTKDT